MQWKCWEPERCGLEKEVPSGFDMHILILCCLLFVWLLCVLALGCTAHSSLHSPLQEPCFGGNVWECVETLRGGVSCMIINDSLSAHTQTETVICLTYFSVRLGTMVKKN